MDMDKRETPRRRPTYPMPDYVRQALEDSGLTGQYQARPHYQRNDYIGWITRAKREETRRKRLGRMLDDLRSGDKYMGMDYRPKRPPPGPVED